MHRNPETLETLTTFGSSGTKLLFPSWLLGFQHEERETQFLLCWLFHLTQQRAVHHVDPTGLASSRFKSQLASPSSESQLTAFFFKNHPKSSAHRFRAWRHSHPQSHFLSGFFSYDISDCHILPAQAWTPALNVCPYSCTKPNSSKPY